jgi:hypothetical protein
VRNLLRPSTLSPLSKLTVRDGDLLLLELTSNPGGEVEWKPNTYFGRDAVVHSAGGYYKVIASAAASGTSGPGPMPFPGPRGSVGNIIDGGLAWMDSGQTSTGQDTWKKSTPYALGDSVVGAGKVYILAAAGASGKDAPGGPVSAGTLVADGDLVWMDLGPTANGPIWAPNSPYPVNQSVRAANGHLYQVIRFTDGISGPPPADPHKSQPDFLILRANMVIDAAKNEVPPDHGISYRDCLHAQTAASTGNPRRQAQWENCRGMAGV